MGERLQQIDQVATFPRFGRPQAPGPEHPSGQADQGDHPQRRCRFILSGLPQALFQLRGARTFHPRAVTPQRQPTLHGHAVGQEVEDARPHGIAEGPPDGHGQMQHRLAKAAKRLARSLSLGAMNLDVEGAGQHKTVGVRLPCTPSHDGCNHDEGLQCPANPVPATVLAGGVFDLFPDFRGEKLTHRARERLRTLGSPLCLFGRCPRGGSRSLCSHGTVLVSMGAWGRTAP